MRCLRVHLTAVGILIAQYVAGELDHHHLHTQADAEGGDVMGTCIFCSDDLAFNTSGSKTRAHHHACHPTELGSHILTGDMLAVDEVDIRLHIIIDTSEVQTLTDALIGILQVVFPHKCHLYLTRGVTLLVEEVAPGFHGWCLSHWDADLSHDGCIEPLLLHAHWHLVDGGHILALYHTLQIDITKRRHLHAQMVIKVALRTKDENIRLDTHALQFLDGVLSGFGFQLLGSFQIRHIGKMYAHGIATQLPAQLDSLHEGCTLNVADGTAHLCNHEVEALVETLPQHSAFDFIRNMGHHLDGLAQIVAMALAVDDSLVDTACRNRIITGGMYARKTLIVA